MHTGTLGVRAGTMSTTEFDDFYRTHRADAVRWATALIGSPEIGEEIAQDALHALGRGLPVAVWFILGGDSAAVVHALIEYCLLYTSDAADERSSVDLGGRRIIKKKKQLPVVRRAAASLERSKETETERSSTT